MTFISLEYSLFLSILLAFYWIIPQINWRLFVILVASLFFYGSLQIQYIPLLIISIIFNFQLALSIGEPVDWRIANAAWNRRRLSFLILGITLNILLLLGFKYIPFILTSLGTWVNLPWALETGNWVDDHVIAPLGLSFFCFECIAYLIDVYRGAPAATSFFEFATYKFFFPKLISGPITRYHHFKNQLNFLKFPNFEQGTEGLWLIATGATKKGLIADNLGIFVELSFNNLERASSTDLWLAMIAYGLQLYLDFSGYVDLARGTAMLMGLNLPQNFDFPYFSTSIAEFWRRWHITLGDWLRNYLYFPLGGSRAGLLRTCLNLLIVMLIAGIWHGAAWGFIVWGILHGIALVIHRLTEVFFKALNWQRVWETIPGLIIGWGLTQGMVFITWVFFRLPNLQEAMWVIKHGWGYAGDIQFAEKVYQEALSMEQIDLVWRLGLIGVGMGIIYGFNRGFKLQLNWPLKLVLVPLFLYVVWLLAPEGLPYIYFDF